jgi:hypothetical protein
VADPDWQVPLAVLLLEHDHALVVRHVHADALDEHLDHGAVPSPRRSVVE